MAASPKTADQCEREATALAEGPEPRHSEAAELFHHAYIKYRNERSIGSAIIVLQRAIEQWKLVADRRSELRQAYTDLYNLTKTVESAQQYADMCLEEGHFSLAIRGFQRVGDARMLIGDNENAELGAKAYLRAAEISQQEGSDGTAQRYQLEVADIFIRVGIDRFAEAAELFLTVARQCQGNPLTKYGVNSQIRAACLCYASEGTLSEQTLARLDEDFAQWNPSRERAFVHMLYNAKDDADVAKAQSSPGYVNSPWVDRAIHLYMQTKKQ